MNTTKRIIHAAAMFLCMGWFPTTVAFAFSADEVLAPDVFAELSETGFMERSYYKKKNVMLELTPETSLSRQMAMFWPEENDKPTFIAEDLYMIDKDSLGGKDSVSVDRISKIMRSVSKMKGMQYYSHGEKKYETLYHECHFIKGPNDRTPVEDDTEGNADGKVMYCMQDDNSFGKINYRIEYHQNENEVNVNFVNVTTLRVGPIRAIVPGNLRISFVIVNCDDEILIYMLVRSKFPALSMLEKKMKESFSARLDAIYEWFKTQFEL